MRDYIQGVPKKSIPFEMKPLLEVNPYYYAEPTGALLQHSNKAFTSNKGFISKGILFFGTPYIQSPGLYI